MVLGTWAKDCRIGLYRIDYMYRAFTRRAPKIKKRPSEYVKDKFVITTSGMIDHKSADVL